MLETSIKESIEKIMEKSRPLGWVLEPDAKALMGLIKADIPDFILTDSPEKALEFLKSAGSPVVAKAVSARILHKTEYNAVVTGIVSEDHLKKEFTRLKTLDGCENILIEKMITGIEVIIGAKNDFQFGPVIVFGIGGTSVEIYNDTAIRMAPLKPSDVVSMVQSLKAEKIISGYRGQSGVNMNALTDLLVNFSQVIMEFEKDIESIDLNPVICTEDQCITADARIILQC